LRANLEALWEPLVSCLEAGPHCVSKLPRWAQDPRVEKRVALPQATKKRRTCPARSSFNSFISWLQSVLEMRTHTRQVDFGPQQDLGSIVAPADSPTRNGHEINEIRTQFSAPDLCRPLQFFGARPALWWFPRDAAPIFPQNARGCRRTLSEQIPFGRPASAVEPAHR
jgi:hypothetical protein